MSKLNRIILLTLTTYLCSAFNTLDRRIIYIKSVGSFSKKDIVYIQPEIQAGEFTLKTNKLQDFMHDMAYRESSNNPRIVNRWGYMGLYQFGRKTLNSLGYSNVSNRQFLSDESIQHEAMINLLKHNKKVLKRHIKKYNGKMVHGIRITESGLLAAAHLGGAGTVRKFLRTGKVKRDGHFQGTTCKV